MTAYKQVIALLPKLTSAELQQVRARVTALGATVGATVTDDVRDAVLSDWLLDGILAELTTRGQRAALPPLSVIAAHKDYPAYAERSLAARKVLTDAIPGMTKAEMRAMGIFSARSLAQWVAVFLPVSLSTMMRNAGHLSEALERSYPGYLETGMLEKLLKSRWVHG